MKAKKVLSGALAAILLTLTPGVAVCAEEMAGQEQTENTQVLSAQEHLMRRKLIQTRFRTGHRDPRSMRLPAL